MRRIVNVVTRSLYVLGGSFYLLLGLLCYCWGRVSCLPGCMIGSSRWARTIRSRMYLIQETATLWVLMGILLFWFARHYDQSLTFHWAVTFYLSLDAFVHWFSAYGKFEKEPRAIINAVPFFLFLVLGLLRRRYSKLPP